MNTIEEVLQQYSPMISAMIRKLNIYRDFENYRQIGEVALWQAWLRFDKSKGEFTPFAYRTIQGAMLDELNRENRFTLRFEVMEEAGVNEPANFLEEDILPEWLEQVDLSATEKVLLQNLFIDHSSMSELAAQYGISKSALKKRKTRTLKKIRKQIQDNF